MPTSSQQGGGVRGSSKEARGGEGVTPAKSSVGLTQRSKRAHVIAPPGTFRSRPQPALVRAMQRDLVMAERSTARPWSRGSIPPESCVFEIALVSLVGVGTYKKILRPTQNPTLAGMDPLPQGRAVLLSAITRSLCIARTRAG